ncbi:esterase/lipase family protein [Roseisolibacter agri]|uniref:Acetyltransferase n=1 Tax=Roseisolibacter agri TaxID=2014610 RepID=A0AA37Q7Z0_9BACT|nr:alpha/beta fold hydrolase [Roseisolibacter agri]GLC24661.1 acetyltransferase [Roseisolibacter agri]
MQQERGTVVLVHGLGRTRWSMAPLAWAARRRGYAVVNWGYRSRRGTVAMHAAGLADRLAQLAAQGVGPVHLVTHSLGGIVVRASLELPAASAWRHRLGRIVMLAPPNQGSELADRLRAWRVTRRVLGPAFLALGTGPESVARQLGALPAGIEVGVVAGTRNWNPLFGRWMPRPHDGKVSVASTRLAGMTDFSAVARGHTFLMLAPDVHARIFAFLAHGRFMPDRPRPDPSPP